MSIMAKSMNEENLKKVLQSNHVMIGSDGNAISPEGALGDGNPHPRYYGTFPRVLGRYAREEKCFDFPGAVRKMTSMPAEKLGLQKRGLIKENHFADLVVFNPDQIIDRATFINPHQFPKGIEYVFVNGEMAVEKTRHTGVFSGRVLRSGSV